MSLKIGDKTWDGKRQGVVTGIREGWVWVTWRTADGSRGPEVLYCRVGS
jgi:hypothetical protein